MPFPSNPSVFPPGQVDSFARLKINNSISNIPGAAKEYTYSQVAVLSGTIGLTTSATLIAAVPAAQILVWGVDVSNGTAATDTRSLFYSDVVNDNQIVALMTTQGVIGATNKSNFGGQPVCLPVNTALQYSIITAAGGSTNMLVYYSVVMNPAA